MQQKDTSFHLEPSPLEIRAAQEANNQANFAAQSSRHTVQAKSKRAERAFRALQRQVHAARAKEAMENGHNPPKNRNNIANYALKATAMADQEVERVRQTMTSFLEIQGGGCSAQKTEEQCQSMLDLWDATNGADGNICSFCTLPREFGGPKFECMECNSVFEPEKRHWECSVSYKDCLKKKPIPPTPPPTTKVRSKIEKNENVSNCVTIIDCNYCSNTFDQFIPFLLSFL